MNLLRQPWRYDERTFRWTTNESVVVPLDPEHPRAVVNDKILRVSEPLPAQEYRASYAVDPVES